MAMPLTMPTLSVRSGLDEAWQYAELLRPCLTAIAAAGRRLRTDDLEVTDKWCSHDNGSCSFRFEVLCKIVPQHNARFMVRYTMTAKTRSWKFYLAIDGQVLDIQEYDWLTVIDDSTIRRCVIHHDLRLHLHDLRIMLQMKLEGTFIGKRYIPATPPFCNYCGGSVACMN